MSAGVPPIDTLDSSPRALVRALVLEQGFTNGRISFEGCIAFWIFASISLIPGRSLRALFVRGSCRHKLTFAGSPFLGEERDVPPMERASSSLVSFYQVIQARTHARSMGLAVARRCSH